MIHLYHDEIAQEYNFWDKNLLQKTEVYMDIIVETDELFTKHPQLPIFMNNYHRILNIIDERVKNPDKDLFSWSPVYMAYLLLYVISGVSGMGITQRQLNISTGPERYKNKQILDYFLNTVDILDWYKETPEYKRWEEEKKWRQEHPMFARRPKTAEEFARMLSIVHRKMKSGNYIKDRVLKNIKPTKK